MAAATPMQQAAQDCGSNPNSEVQFADMATAAEYSGTGTMRRSGDALPSGCAAAWQRRRPHSTRPNPEPRVASEQRLSMPRPAVGRPHGPADEHAASGQG
eukprot:15056059-Alexandrium_andersonii.AAC.1